MRPFTFLGILAVFFCFAFKGNPGESPLPCFSSPRLNALMNKTPKPKEEWEAKKLSEADLASLDVMALVIYAHHFPEQYYQSCSRYSRAADESEKIHSILPRKGEGLTMSFRQWESLKKNRDSVMYIISHCFENEAGISDDYKQTIVNLAGYEAIPTLKKILERQPQKLKDTYILTVLMLLMKNDQYAPFIATELYKALYNEENKDFRKEMTVALTNKRRDEILALAGAYYELKKAGK
ncbi:MAG: hypothetical protein JWO09_252 [Bacteroidetes bacterium]|nr:hypothetical protein [Bacteroidota bacterium]